MLLLLFRPAPAQPPQQASLPLLFPLAFAPAAPATVVPPPTLYQGGAVRDLHGFANGVGAAAASLQVLHHLASAAAGVGAASAALQGVHNLAATGAGAGAATASLQVVHNFATTSTGAAAVSAALQVKHHLASSAAGVGTSAAALQVRHHFASSAAGVAAVTDSAQVIHNLAGSSTGRATAGSSLTVTGPIPSPLFVQLIGRWIAGPMATAGIQPRIPQPIDWPRGEDGTVGIILIDHNDQPFVLNLAGGDSIVMSIGPDLHSGASISISGSQGDALNRYKFSILASNTTLYPAGQMVYEVRATQGGLTQQVSSVAAFSIGPRVIA